MKKGKNIIQREYEIYNKGVDAGYRKKTTGMTQTIGNMIAKVVIGAIFIVAGFATQSLIGFLISFIIGVGLIAWGVIPYYMAKKQREADEIKSILAQPLETYEDAELKAAINRIEESNARETDDLKKYKEMRDSGLISNDDYDQKKKQILRL